MLQGYGYAAVLLVLRHTDLPQQYLACVATHQQHISSANRQQGYTAGLISMQLHRAHLLQLEWLCCGCCVACSLCWEGHDQDSVVHPQPGSHHKFTT
jgi:hypothetical protein